MSNASPISISVALVTRNRPRSVERCLESWRRQTVQPDEIVVSDDSDAATAHETEEVARRYGCRYTRGPRRGLYANRNHASLQCRGTHIVSADDDHTHPADYAAVIRDLIATDPERVWIFSERMPGDSSSPLACPPELHRSGFGLSSRESLAVFGIRTSQLPAEMMPEGRAYFAQHNQIAVVQTALVENTSLTVNRLNQQVWGEVDGATLSQPKVDFLHTGEAAVLSPISVNPLLNPHQQRSQAHSADSPQGEGKQRNHHVL